jgi:hypothetical protein
LRAVRVRAVAIPAAANPAAATAAASRVWAESRAPGRPDSGDQATAASPSSTASGKRT